jgi:hypothetical protein
MPGTERVIAFSQLAVKGLSQNGSFDLFFLLKGVIYLHAQEKQQSLSKENNDCVPFSTSCTHANVVLYGLAPHLA